MDQLKGEGPEGSTEGGKYPLLQPVCGALRSASMDSRTEPYCSQISVVLHV